MTSSQQQLTPLVQYSVIDLEGNDHRTVELNENATLRQLKSKLFPEREDVGFFSQTKLDHFSELVDEDKPIGEHQVYYRSLKDVAAQHNPMITIPATEEIIVDHPLSPNSPLKARSSINGSSGRLEHAIMVLINKGETYMYQKNYNVAIDYFSTALDLDPSRSLTYTDRGNCYVRMREYKKAIADYNVALEGGVSIVKLYNRGYAHMKDRNFPLAIQDFNTLLSIDRTYTDAYCARAKCYFREGNSAMAMQDIAEALKLNETNRKAYSLRSKINTKNKNYSEALLDVERGITLNPRDPRAYVMRSNIYLEQGNLDQALLECNRALEGNEFMKEVHVQRGLIQLQRKQAKQAIIDFSQALTIDPNYAEALWLRSQCYQDHREYERAIQDYDRLITLQPDRLVDILERRAECYTRIKQNHLALNDYNTILGFNNANYKAYHQRGSVLLNLKDYEKAIADFDSSIVLKPDFNEAQVLRKKAEKRKSHKSCKQM